MVGRLLADLFDRVVTVDPHLHRTRALGQALPGTEADSVSAADACRRWLDRLPDDTVVIGPDSEAAQWVEPLAGGRDWAVLSKTRLGDRAVEMEIEDTMDLAGRPGLLVDDVCSTGVTLMRAAELLKRRGAAEVTALVTHALFDRRTARALREAGVTRIVSTDSVRHPTNRIRLAGTLAAALAPALRRQEARPTLQPCGHTPDF